MSKDEVLANESNNQENEIGESVVDSLTYIPATEVQENPITIGNDTALVENENGGTRQQENARYPRRQRTKTEFFDLSSANAVFSSEVDPKSIAEAVKCPDANQWKEAIRSEL